MTNIINRTDRLIKADRSLDLTLKFCVVNQIARSERLFDHEQPEVIELLNYIQVTVE